jgi:hypothetical protein
LRHPVTSGRIACSACQLFASASGRLRNVSNLPKQSIFGRIHAIGPQRLAAGLPPL